MWDLHLELDWHFPADMEDKPFYCLFGTQGVSACVLEVNWPGFLFLSGCLFMALMLFLCLRY